MKNNLLWAGVILSAVILGAIMVNLNVAMAPQGTDEVVVQEVTKTGMTSTKTTTSSPAPVSGMKTSLGGIFNEKGNYQCDYESVTPQSRASNVVYISNGKMRGEFRTIEAGASKSSIVIYDGSYLYVWTEGQSTGKISQPKTLADLPGIIPENVSSGKILGSGLNSVSWNCHAWSLDSSMLTRPSYVTFN